MTAGTAPILCRNCLSTPDSAPVRRCPACGSPRLISHQELHDLAIAHIDCDAFYASVEKRDDPSLLNRPVIIGGGSRGVVAAACYVARVYGVRSAMPLAEAKRRCPHGVYLRGNFEHYREASQIVVEILRTVTPVVQVASIDEAYLDITGSVHLFGGEDRIARQLKEQIYDCLLYTSPSPRD